MSLRQRQPRTIDPGYLKWLRTQPCACCGQAAPSDAAHVRSASALYEKRETGIGEKPDDKWALPLKHSCHMDQHSQHEMEWWRWRGIVDPFGLCIWYYARYRMLNRCKKAG